MVHRRIILLLACLAIATVSFAGGSMFSGNGLGEEQVNGGARTLGLGGGGFGFADSMSFNSQNPALIAFTKSTIIRMSGQVAFWTTSDNGQSDSDAETTWREFRLYLSPTAKYKIGIGAEPSRRSQLKTFEQKQAVFPGGTYDYEQRTVWNGSTVDLRLDNAYQFSEKFSLGTSLGYTFLHNEREITLDFVSTDVRSGKYTEINSYRGWWVSFGTFYKPSSQLGIGGYFKPRRRGNWTNDLTQSDRDSTLSSSQGVGSPGEYGIGISYELPPGFLMVADMKSGMWDEEDFGYVVSNKPKDPLFLSVGFERLARKYKPAGGLNDWAYRAGFFYRQHYWTNANGDAVKDYGISLGTSAPIGKSRSWLHATAEFGMRGDEEKFGAKESFFRLNFEFELGETWFERNKPRIPRN